jgi:CyaY protein
MPQPASATTPSASATSVARIAIFLEKAEILTEGVSMDESAFNALAEAELARIEAAIEASGADVDIEQQPGGVLELEFGDGSKMVINRHSAAREIWVAARAGGFHFRSEAGRWLNTRDGAELYAMLSALVSAQAGEQVVLRPQA